MKEYIEKITDKNDEEIELLEEQMKEYESELGEVQKHLEWLRRQEDAQTNIFSPRTQEQNIEEKIEAESDAVCKLNQKINSLKIKMESLSQKDTEQEKQIHQSPDETHDNWQEEKITIENNKESYEAIDNEIKNNIKNKNREVNLIEDHTHANCENCVDKTLSENDPAKSIQSLADYIDQFVVNLSEDANQKKTGEELKDISNNSEDKLKNNFKETILEKQEDSKKQFDEKSKMGKEKQNESYQNQVKLKMECVCEETNLEKIKNRNTTDESSLGISSVNETDMKKFLSDIYSKTELCLALLKSDRNRCKREMQEIKRMVKKYADELENK
jgi:uncharacterized protein YlxP (DUF503 family)